MLRFLALVCFLFIAVAGFAQNPKPLVTVSGLVLSDSTKTPLPRISVIARPSRFGTTTQANGSFKIKAAPGDTLYFSSVGYKTGIYVVTKYSNQIVKIYLSEKSTMLKEVEVSTRPSADKINRALRNKKQAPAPDPVKAPPPPKPMFVEKPVQPVAPSAFNNPASFLYEKYSREGKEKQKMADINQAKQDSINAKKEAQYDKLFLDRNKPFRK
jgi:hypothetical protein